MAVGTSAVRDVTVRLLADVDNYSREVQAAADVTGNLVSHLTRVEEAMDRTFRRAGAGLVGFGLSLQATAGLTGRAAAGWEQAFVNVEKTVDGTEQQLRGLNITLRQMAARDIPVAAEGLAELASLAGQLGVETETLDEFVEVAAQLGVATDLSAQAAIFSLSQFTNIMGEAEQNIDRVSSALVEMGNTTQSTEGQILDFSTRIAGAANVVNLTSADVLGIAAAMASVGVEAERGGTAVQKVLLAMNDAVTAGTQRLDVFARTLGMTREQFREMFRSDPSEAFIGLVEALQSAGTEANNILRSLELTDQRLVAAFLSLANAGEDVRSIITRSNRAFSENNALQQEAGRFFGTTASKWSLLGGAISESTRALGEGFLPVTKGTFDILTALVNVFNAIPGPIKTTMGLLIGLTGVMAAVAGAALLMHKAIGAAAFVRSAMGMKVVTNALDGLLFGLRVSVTQARLLAIENSRLGAVFFMLGNRIHLMVEGLRGIMRLRLIPWLASGGRAAQALATGLTGITNITGSLIKSLGGLSIAAAAVGAAMVGMNMMADRAQDNFLNSSEAADALAESLGLSLAAFEELTKAEEEAGAASLRFRQQHQQLLETLQEATTYAERAAAIRDITFNMQLRGATQQDIDKLLGQLQENVDFEIPLGLDLSDFDAQLDSLAIIMEREGERAANAWYNRFSAALSVAGASAFVSIFGSREYEDMLRGRAEEVVALLGSADAEAQLQGVQYMQAVTRGIEEGIDDPRLAQDMKGRFARFLTQAGMGDEIALSIRDRLLAGTADIGGVMEELVSEGMLPAFKDMEKAATSAGVTLEGTYHDKLLQLVETQERWLPVLEESKRTLDSVSGAAEDQGELVALLGDRYHDLEQAAQSAYVKDIIRQEESKRGAAGVIVMLERQLDILRETGQEYGELGRTVSSELERVRRELQQTGDQALRQLEQMLDQQQRLFARADEARARHAERAASLQEDRAESLADAQEQLNERLEDANRQYEQGLEQRTQTFTQWASLTEREWSQHTMSLARIIANADIQSGMFEAWQRGLEELRDRGLSEEAIEQLGLSESPRALQQVERILAGSAEQIGRLNEVVAERTAQAQSMAADETQELASELAASRAEATQQYEETVADINERFAEQLGDLHSDLNSELGSISDELGNIGADAAESWTDTVERGLASGNERIAAQARLVEDIMRAAAENIRDDASDIMSLLAQTNQAADNTAARIESFNADMRAREAVIGGAGPGGDGGGLMQQLMAAIERVLVVGGGSRGMQHGAVLTRPTLLAEGTTPEVVLPLNRQGAEFVASTMERYKTPSGDSRIMGELRDAIRELGGGDGFGGMRVENMNVRPSDLDDFMRQVAQRTRSKRLVMQGGRAYG